jgi:hypothetical protein
MAIVVLVSSTLAPVFTAWRQQSNYDLSAAKNLLDSTPDYLQKKLTYDPSKNSWLFNQSTTPQLPVDTDDSVSMGDVNYGAILPNDLASSPGLKLSDSRSKLDISLKPKFAVDNGQEQGGHIVYPLTGSKSQLVYSFKHNGVKEDIILYQSPGDTAEYSYSLDLPKGMEARLQNNGSVGIFGGDPTLFDNMSYGSDKDKSLVEKVRESSAKTHLYYEIPAPVITGKGTNKVKAEFTLDNNKLTVKVGGLDDAAYPLSIDPSFVMDTTGCAWQGSGNNEDNINFSGCQISRSGLTGGTVSNWTQVNTGASGYVGSNGAAYNTAVAYNGFLYSSGGANTNNSNLIAGIRYAAINSSTGSIGAWTTNATSPASRQKATMLAHNGYMYVVGGGDLSNPLTSNVIQYAKINSDGSLGSWQTNATTYSTNRQDAAVVAYGNYLYVMGGNLLSGNYVSDVQYATFQADGSLGSWSTSATSTPDLSSYRADTYNGYVYITPTCGAGANCTNAGTVYTASLDMLRSTVTSTSWKTSATIANKLGQSIRIVNGYAYVMGGYTGGQPQSGVQIAKVYADGSLGPWQATTALSIAINDTATAAYNGYLYAIAGGDDAIRNFAPTSTSQYASINSVSGAMSSFKTDSNALVGSGGVQGAATVVYGGYMYLLGGGDASSANNQTARVLYAKLNADGSLGSWTSSTNVYTDARTLAAATAYNGYLYIAGGSTPSALATTHCSSVVGTIRYCRDIQYAAIDPSDGSVGTWQYAGAEYANTGDNGRAGLGMVGYNGYMYIVGGDTNSNTIVSSEADVALICTGANNGVGGCGATAGTVGTWTRTAGALGASGRARFQLALIGKYAYIVGGRTQGSNTNNDTLYAAMSNDGTAPTFASAGSATLANTTAELITGAYNGYLYAATGADSGAITGTTIVQYIKTDPSTGLLVGNWATASATVTNARMRASGGIYNGFLYVGGGCSNINLSNCATIRSDMQYAQIYNGGGGRGQTSGTTTVLPAAARGTMSVYANGYIYAIGGVLSNSPVTYQKNVYYAKVNGDGTLGAWTATSFLNTARGVAAVTAANGYIYVFGGGSSANTTGEYAKINGDGTLGSWTQFSKGDNRDNATSFALNGYLYIAGGQSGLSLATTVLYAPIGANGAPGSWSTTTASFTGGRLGLRGFSAGNGSVYILGGAGTSAYDDVQYATPTGSGDITSWSYGPSFPFARSRFSVAVANGYVYVYSGINSSTVRSDVYYAPILASGALGTWNYAGTISGTALYEGGTASSGGFLYLLGGTTNGSTVNDTVSFLPLQGTPSTAHYSLNLTTDMRTLPANYFTTVSPQAGSSSINTAFSMATATSGFIFGTGDAGLQSSVKYPVTMTNSDGGSAYSILITLDDTASTYFGEGSTAGSSLSYLKLNYHPNPAMRLRGGKTFNSNVLQSLDAP